jgi:cell filamentation protein
MIDPYVYQGTNILINKAGIKNQKELDRYENKLSTLGIAKLRYSNLIITSTLNIFSIHETIFKEVYDWAGKPRTINLSKTESILNGLSVNYYPYHSITHSLKELDKTYFNFDWSLTKYPEQINKLTNYISLIWKIHPFREGNTRSVSVFLYLFVKQKLNLNINHELLQKHAKFFRNALVMASIQPYEETSHLKIILTDSLSRSNKKPGKTKQIKTNKYNNINQYKINQYRYNYHQKTK